MSRFKTKARAVDLLGEKQIKDDTTAISELFKNSHDADATQAEMSVDTSTNTIVLWDNGHGMSPEEVELKWLTLGTDSKLSVDGKARKSERFARIMMGEKGIGRLAIATLGKQMLMVTRRAGHPYTVVYIHWDVFTNGNLLLEDTAVPVQTVDTVDGLSAVIPRLKQTQVSNLLDAHGELKQAWQGHYEELARRILQDIQGFTLADSIVLPVIKRIESFGQGTAFYVTQPKEDWKALADPAQVSPRLKRKRQNLAVMMSSFINTLRLFEGQSQDTYLDNVYDFYPRILVDGQELVSPEVFTPEDLNKYDYALVGRMVNGRFVGQALIYGREPEQIHLDCTEGIDLREDADCGPFEFRLYFLEGDPKHSHLPKEAHQQFQEKLDRIGGIYVYRDGLRVLPYGTPDFDFLEIELRRSLKAGRYLFSLRRMFGYIAISKEANPKLEDKSSREGLRENAQYEFFRTTLKNLLIWFAVVYLNKEGRRFGYMQDMEERYRRQQAEEELQRRQEQERKEYLQRLEKQVQAGQQSLRKRRQDLERQIEARFPSPGKLSLSLMLRLQGKQETYFELFSLIQDLEHLRAEIRRKISAIDEGIRPSFDPRFALLDEAKELEESYSELLEETRGILFAKLDERWEQTHQFLTAKRDQFLNQIAQQVNTTSGGAFLQGLHAAVQRSSQSVADAKKRAEEQLVREVSARAERYYAQLQSLRYEVDLRKDQTLADWTEPVASAFDSSEQKASDVMRMFDQFVALESSEDLPRLASEIQAGVDSVSQDLARCVELADTHIQRAVTEMAIPSLDVLEQATGLAEDRQLIAVLENRVQEMNSQMEQYRSLVATGLAAEVVSHEFDQQYDLVRQIFNKPAVRAMIQSNEDLARIEHLFKHIEERHRLMSPLYRRTRMYRKRLNLRDVGERMREFFSSHFALYEIEFRNEIEDAFVVYESEPILYPVFINIINNSIYWLLNRQHREILVRSNARKGYLYLEDSGPGIPPDRVEWIFGLFNSTRLDGRGIGLHLVRELLGSRNHLITCVTDGHEKMLNGACFRVQFDPGTVQSTGGQ